MSRRRKRTRRSDQWFKVFLLIAFLIAGIAFAIGFGFSGGQFDTTLFLIVFVVTLVLAVIGYFILSSPSTRGGIGEMRVSDRLKDLEKEYGGTAFHNIMIAGKDGHTSQIDHIYICTKGVFVIETKNYSGRIYGKDSQDKWTQVMNYGKTKNHFYNPVKQNYTHVCRVRDYLGADSHPESIVVFVQGNVSYIESEYVYTLSDLRHLFDRRENVLSERIVTLYCDKIQKLIDNPVTTQGAHVQEIKKTQQKIKEGVCPRCGGQLVLRTSKQNGQKFYGCPNYPKCRFTKKADTPYTRKETKHTEDGPRGTADLL